MKLTFKDIEERGLLLYRYVRGSHVYGTNTPESDRDEGGVYICPAEDLLGLGLDYQDEVSDEKHDTCWWELGKFMNLVLSSNPTVLEALFVPDEYVIYEHPIMTGIKRHRDAFITKACFMPFGGYAVSQIRKARGQNKKIHWDIEQMTRKTPLDFCFTPDGRQGSVNIRTWLDERGLDQRNCGCVNIPNMPGMYGVYYDFGQHMKFAGIDRDYFSDRKNFRNDKFVTYMFYNHLDDFDRTEMTYEWGMGHLYDEIRTPIGKHCGIVNPDMSSNTIRFSETDRNERPICLMSYNQNGYETHCRMYREYEEWKEKRNRARYENNLEGKKDTSKFYDAKNMCHCFRLLNMCIEVARGDGFRLDRRGIDADFLLDVRNRKYTYDELIGRLEKLKERMDEEISKSGLPERIDPELVDRLLLDARRTLL